MRNKPPRLTGLQFLAFTLIGLAFFVASGIFLNPFRNIEASIYESPVFANAAEARKHITISLPDEATNIRFAGYREWLAVEDLMRFEAPTDTCLKHAELVLPGKEILPINAEDLARAARQPFGSHFKDSSWFDLHKATNVVHISGGPSQAEIWIDQDRGVLYYRMTD
jgi:hypothetical protein